MIRQYIAKVVESRDLSVEESRSALTEIMEGRATDAQVAAFITALRMKGETVDEIIGAAMVMREKATHVSVHVSDVLDTCGTGGDATHTFNISTATALVAAGAGVTVAKHGNRSVTSGSGSAEVLQALGVKIDAPLAVVERCLSEAGIGFLFAPMLHGAMKYAIGPRREVAIRTIFNILGPLTNPAGANRQLMGVYDAALTRTLAEVLAGLGSMHALVVHGSGLDEMTTTGPTQIAEARDGEVRTYELRPEQVGIPAARVEDLIVEDPDESAHAIRAILDGEPGPKRDIVLLNAAAALYVAGKADTIQDGVPLADATIDNGDAKHTLERLVDASNRPG